VFLHEKVKRRRDYLSAVSRIAPVIDFSEEFILKDIIYSMLFQYCRTSTINIEKSI